MVGLFFVTSGGQAAAQAPVQVDFEDLSFPKK